MISLTEVYFKWQDGFKTAMNISNITT